MQQIYSYLSIILLTLVSLNLWANNEKQECINQGFKNSYILVGLENIAGISSFFNQVPIEYFLESNEFFQVSIGDKNRLETYFDDKNLTLLLNNKELFLDKLNHLPIYRSERERLILNDINTIDTQTLIFDVRSYNKKKSSLDKHILFGRVKRKQRLLLINKLEEIVKNPVGSIESRLQINHNEVVQVYSHFGIGIGSITWGQFNVSSFGINKTFSLLKFEIYYDSLKKLKKIESDYLNQFYCDVYLNFRQEFPLLEVMPRFGYADYNKLSEGVLPNRLMFEKHPMLFSVGQIVTLVFIGFLFLYLLIGRYKKRDNYRQVSINSLEKKDDH